MSGETFKPFDEPEGFRKWFDYAENVIERGDFSLRELLAMAWNAATPPGTEVVPEGTMIAVKAAIDSLEALANTADGAFTKDDSFALTGLRAILTRHRATQKGGDTFAKNPNLLFYEYEMDLKLAAKALEASMPNAAERVRFLAGILAKTKPKQDKETPNAQG